MSEPDRFQDIHENDVFKILVATDIHLGYDEKDPIKGNFRKKFNPNITHK